MSWKFWEKPEYEPEFIVETNDVPTSTLLRWYLYDSGSKSPNKRAEALGFTPVSAEGEEMELRESRERLDNLDPYVGFLAMMSDISGLVTAETFSEHIETLGLALPEDMDEEEAKERIADMFTSFAISCLIPSFSAALQLGIIVNPGTFVTEIE